MAFIYRINNTVNNKFYVGATTRTIEQRFKEHLGCAKKGQRGPLLAAIRKYGDTNFSVALLEEVPDADIDDSEKRHIHLLKPPYNIKEGGGNGKLRLKRVCITNGAEGRYITEHDAIPDGWWRGLSDHHRAACAAAKKPPRSAEAIQRTAEKHRGMKRSASACANMSASARSWNDRRPRGVAHHRHGHHWWTDGTSSILAATCPPGWSRGRVVKS